MYEDGTIKVKNSFHSDLSYPQIKKPKIISTKCKTKILPIIINIDPFTIHLSSLPKIINSKQKNKIFVLNLSDNTNDKCSIGLPSLTATKSKVAIIIP